MKLTIHTKPCITEKDRIIASAALDMKPGFDKMCTLLKAEFQNITCSQKLGLVKINWNKKTIIIFKSGKISIRKAEDEDDAIKAIHKVSKALGKN